MVRCVGSACEALAGTAQVPGRQLFDEPVDLLGRVEGVVVLKLERDRVGESGYARQDPAVEWTALGNGRRRVLRTPVSQPCVRDEERVNVPQNKQPSPRLVRGVP